MSQIKTSFTKVESVIDSETGEILDTVVNKHKYVVSKEKFLLFYVEALNIFITNELKPVDKELYAYLLSLYPEGTPFTITRYIIEQVCKKSNKKVTSYKKSPAALIKANLLYKVSDRSYKINPEFAYMGSTSNRKKAIIEMIEEKTI